MTTIIGIDPGLVDTAVVVMHFTPGGDLHVESHAFQLVHNKKIDPRLLVDFVKRYPKTAHVFVEAYRPRGNSYGTDAPMRDLMQVLKLHLQRAQVIDNTGMKGVVTQELMELLGVWRFGTSTHHQDLRSAARIGLYGALKDEVLNRVVYDYVVGRLP